MDLTIENEPLLRQNLLTQSIGSSFFIPGVLRDSGLNQDYILNRTLDISQPQFDHFHAHSSHFQLEGSDSTSTYDTFASLLNPTAIQGHDTYYRAIGLGLRAASFQSDPLRFPELAHAGVQDLQANLLQPSQANPSVYYATNNLGLSDVVLENNLQPKTSHSVPEGSPSSSSYICHEADYKIQSFSASPVFRKHHQKHKQPFACTHLSCNHLRFSSKANLVRHSREVHGDKIRRCPLTSCARYRDGFGRKYNLLKHQLTCHDKPWRGRAKRRRRNIQEETIPLDELSSKVEEKDEEGEKEGENDGGAAIDLGSESKTGIEDGAAHQWRNQERNLGERGSSPLLSAQSPISEYDEKRSQPRSESGEERGPKTGPMSPSEITYDWKLRHLKLKRNKIDREIAKLEKRAVRAW